MRKIKYLFETGATPTPAKKQKKAVGPVLAPRDYHQGGQKSAAAAKEHNFLISQLLAAI
jgi:hypothetical protein